MDHRLNTHNPSLAAEPVVTRLHKRLIGALGVKDFHKGGKSIQDDQSKHWSS